MEKPVKLLWRNDFLSGTFRGTGLADQAPMDHSPHRRPKPKVPEPIEDDPFEMDWPWPGMLPPDAEASIPAEPPLAEPEAEPADEGSHIDGNGV